MNKFIILSFIVATKVFAFQDADFTLNAGLQTAAVVASDQLKVSMACDKCTEDKEHWWSFGINAPAAVAFATIAGAKLHVDGEINDGRFLVQQVTKYLVDREKIDYLASPNGGSEQFVFVFANDD